MKKQLLTLSLLFLATLSYGQFFKITPAGYVSESDSTKNYYVMDHTKLNKQELYKKSLLYFNGLFTSPKDVISTVQDESITVNFIDRYKIVMGSLWTVNMSYTINFKDGKVKVSAPYINKIYNDKFNTITINRTGESMNFPIYKRNGSGELRGSDGLKTKTILEDKSNQFILAYINELMSDKVAAKDTW